MLENNVGIVEILMEDSNKQNSYITQCNLPLSCSCTFLNLNTYRWSRKSREASLSTLTRQTYNTTGSSQTLRT